MGRGRIRQLLGALAGFSYGVLLFALALLAKSGVPTSNGTALGLLIAFGFPTSLISVFSLSLSGLAVLVNWIVIGWLVGGATGRGEGYVAGRRLFWMQWFGFLLVPVVVATIGIPVPAERGAVVAGTMCALVAYGMSQRTLRRMLRRLDGLEEAGRPSRLWLRVPIAAVLVALGIAVAARPPRAGFFLSTDDPRTAVLRAATLWIVAFASMAGGIAPRGRNSS